MDVQKLVESLHPLERAILPALTKHTAFDEVAAASALETVTALRALQWLSNKGLVTLTQTAAPVITLGENGRRYAAEGLPEKKFLGTVAAGKKSLSEIEKITGLHKEELSISIGVLRAQQAISIVKAADIIVEITPQGKVLLQQGFSEEKFLQKKFPVQLTHLTLPEQKITEQLKKRKEIIQLTEEKLMTAVLTELGKKIAALNLKESFLESVTPEIIKSRAWNAKKFRRYDISSSAPKILGGRKQHYRRFLDDIRQKFLSLGFTECFGPVVETDFWDMDALYMPQFHSARDIHQGYQIKEPTHARELPKDKVAAVKTAHEHGGETGSTGWQYDFDFKRTHRHILRTHDTSISARTLASKNLEVPGKYFQMARCFRYDVIDATHLSDFNQVGGFVIEEGINFRHLKGLLKMFAEEFAQTDQIKLVPGYFPFTEPSVELHAKHPQLGWIELAGSGIFRPELVKPLVGREVPVIAWGIGLDRLAMFKLGIKDIRQLFSHDLQFLRNVKVV